MYESQTQNETHGSFVGTCVVITKINPTHTHTTRTKPLFNEKWWGEDENQETDGTFLVTSPDSLKDGLTIVGDSRVPFGTSSSGPVEGRWE